MKRIYLVFLLLFSLSILHAQEIERQTIGVDTAVKIGKLKNGLTYYVRHNVKPKNKVELRLVVNAGSILEDEDQQGLAHLMEHMAFNGTKNFKKNNLVSFLQSIGVSFGADLNAYTSFDETVYILPVPTDKPGNLQKGFQILKDWAANITLNKDDIDNERPIILEESRMGKGANDRILRQMLPRMLAGSKYANRLPIGIDSIVKNAPYSALKQFYHDWYRPNLMAVVAVGDVDAEKLESLVKEYFSDMKNPQNERERQTIDLPAFDSSSAKVITDPEAVNYQYLIYYSPHKTSPEKTLGDLKNNIEKNMFISMLNRRLMELTQQENPPFVYAGAGFSSYARHYESFIVNVSAGSKPDTSALFAVEKELERVKRFGFTKAELDRVKSEMLNSMERSFKEKNKTESGRYAAEYIRNFLTGEPIPGIANEFEYYKQLLPIITLSDLKKVAEHVFENNRSFIALSGPQTDSSNLPSTAQLLAIQAHVHDMSLQPYQEKVLAASLLDKEPTAGKILSAYKNDTLKTTDYVLSNGVTVTIKQTDFKNDQVSFSAVRPGGKSNYGLRDKYDLEFMIDVINSMGLGDFTPVQLNNYLSGKTVQVAPVLGEMSIGFAGGSSVKDLETLFQLLYLYSTEPRKDTALFKSFVQRNKSQLAFLSLNPQVTFIDTVFNTLYQNNPLAPMAIPKVRYFDKIDVDRILEIFRKLYGNAYGMHYTFVGNIDEESIRPLLEKYLASIPSQKKDFAWQDNGVRPVEGVVDLNVKKGKEQKALILKFYSGETPYSEALELRADAISEILNIRIIEELREEIKGIYGGSTSFQMEKLPYEHYMLVFQLPCAPEKVDTLLYAVNQEVTALIKSGPSEEILNKVKKQWLEKYRENIKNNDFWNANLQQMYFPGKSVDFFLNYEEHVKSLSANDIREAAATLLNTKNIFTAVLTPENAEK